MNKDKRHRGVIRIAATAMFLLGGLLLLTNGISSLSGTSAMALLAQLLGQTRPGLVQTAAVVNANSGQDSASFNGVYEGEIAIQGVQTGVYSNTLTLPTVPTDTIPADYGAIALSLQLTQTDTIVTGYVLLERSLTFAAAHMAAIPGQGTIAVGPAVRGTYDGTTLTLESERFSSMVSGREVIRQFRLISSAVEADGGRIVGNYRETMWGFAIEASTAMGQGTLSTAAARRLVIDTSTADRNTSPLAVNDMVSTTPDTTVTINALANDADAEADPLTITDVDPPANGTFTSDGKAIIYTPNAGFTGTDTFTYVVSDSNGGTAVGTVVVEVAALPPDATAMPITPEPGSTETPITPEPGTTAMPTTPEPGATETPVTPEPGTTATPATPEPGSTATPATPEPGSTATPATPEPGVTPDNMVPDDDQDGIPNSDEDVNKDGDLTNDDTDSDGIPNYQDDDDDGDGTPTKAEGTSDANANGTPDYLEKEIAGTQSEVKVFLPVLIQ